MKRQNIRRSQHGVKSKPILASICPCQPFYCSTLQVKRQTVVDIVSWLFLHDPVAQPFDIFSTHLTQISELRTGYMVSHSERSPDMCCRMGFTVTCASRTARQEAESLWDRPVMRVFKGSKQLPIKKARLLCLCGRYGVNAVARNSDHWISAWSAIDFGGWGFILKLIIWVIDGCREQYDPLTNLTVLTIFIAWWLVYKSDGRVRCVMYSYTGDMKGECMCM